ncbi:hypothetical protein POM88_042188 [Heracleum sosnowskyi]|uniref:Endonuclease/exonuclease/phosphatase domain-containing protein n=1 Tax=Heracleum sosnowskyi TaxID=360622 RepID=A0AAD8HI58_9APIA|nr:hypothetical protein POM88_042188 [Heracleum sosnowskyi]
MNVLAWNCQGLGSPGKIQFLQEVTRCEKPAFVFLCETVSSYENIEKLCGKLKFDGFIAVDPQRKSGGIALFWKIAGAVNIMSLSTSHIDVTISRPGSSDWRLTGIYGEPARSQRFKTWELLKNLSRDANLPWCLVGDFNNVISQAEKRGGPSYPDHLIEGFKDCLHEANLQDLEIIGHQFTWERGRTTDHWTEIKLDRVLANPQWLSIFDMAKVYNLEISPSDHTPLLLCPEMQTREIE